MSGVARNAPWEWFKANGLPRGIPVDAELHVDPDAGTITVEVFVTDEQGRTLLHSSAGLMTRLETFPLKVSPPPGLLDAYQHTVRRLRRERDAATAIRYETADTLIDRLGLDPARVFEALDLPIPTRRIGELCLSPTAVEQIGGFTEADAPSDAERAERVREYLERQIAAAPPRNAH